MTTLRISCTALMHMLLKYCIASGDTVIRSRIELELDQQFAKVFLLELKEDPPCTIQMLDQ